MLYGKTVWDPLLIVSQIATLQLVHYAFTSLLVVLLVGAPCRRPACWRDRARDVSRIPKHLWIVECLASMVLAHFADAPRPHSMRPSGRRATAPPAERHIRERSRERRLGAPGPDGTAAFSDARTSRTTADACPDADADARAHFPLPAPIPQVRTRAQ